MENSGRRHRQVRTDLQASLLTVLAADSNDRHRMTSPESPDAILAASSEEIIYDDCHLFDHMKASADINQDQHLAEVIQKRIGARLPGRIHQLAVKVTDNAVILFGQCSTYYTKQLAQHAAMGVLDYQRLVNNIRVRAVR